MEAKITRAKTLLFKVFLVLSIFLFTFCQEHGEEIVDTDDELMFTKYSEITTLMKTAVGVDNGEQCIYYQYPITFYAQFNTISSIEAVAIDSDDELFDFFDELSSSDQVRIDFPINLLDVDGEVTEVNTLEQFKETLQVVIDACSGNGEYDYCHENNKKVYICHNGNTLCVSINAINAHLEHGDTLGECEESSN
ncbi:MAG: hypothetical protein QNJ57_03010 [Flavobacteriaceae bacterium]|nr:hypothetical protein [Flavobacteriaceae bacterium]